MKIVVLDSTSTGAARGPGSPAYFSRYVIERLRQRGDDITILGAFNEGLCAAADVVWSEWCNEEAYAAAESGVCRKLIIRMRGYDVWGPLDKLAWSNVDALVCESPFLVDLAKEKFPGVRAAVAVHEIPSGVDLPKIPFRERSTQICPTVALVARATSDKGYQLAMEWARQRPNVRLDMALAMVETNPRLVEYLKHAAPSNVHLHGAVDTVPWLEEIGADYLLSASIWETLGYTIAEAAAMGIKPLVHAVPGATRNWPRHWLWFDFADLDALVLGAYDSREYRNFVEGKLSEEVGSAQFISLLDRPSTRDRSAAIESQGRRYYEVANQVFTAARTAIERPSNLQALDQLVTDFRSRLQPHTMASTQRFGSALATAVAHYNHADLAGAEVWALRAMIDYVRPDALALLGDTAEGRGDLEEAVQWYKAACAVDDTPNRYQFRDLIDNRWKRLNELMDQLVVKLPRGKRPKELIVVVTQRNAERWIERCLTSIQMQTMTSFRCYVVDDVSTDSTPELIEEFCEGDPRFRIVRNRERMYQARNTVEMPRRYTSSPEDVVVLLDGDDWLAEDFAFEKICDAYERGAWLTYGQLVESTGKPTRFGRYPKRIAEAGNFANWVWCATPPRSFKRFLLDELKNEDFMLDGEWPKVSGDICVLMPMLQLACERAVGLDVPLYVYNTETPDSEHVLDAYEQTRVRDQLLLRPKKPRLVR